MPTFDELEISNYEGAPVFLYEFLRQSGGTNYYWYYNSSESDVVDNGNTYLATSISDDGVRQDSEASNTELNITMPITDDFPQMFSSQGASPSDTIVVTVRRLHRFTGGLTESRVFWVGFVTGVTQEDEIKCRISCMMILASFKRGGLRLSWTRGCPFALYDQDCKVDPLSFQVIDEVAIINGNVITFTTISSFDNGWFNGGYIEWTLPSGFVERRAIKSHTGDIITIHGTPFGLAVTDSVNLYPGCRRTVPVCEIKFGNIANYGGFKDMPGKSPFSGDPVF